MSVNEIDVNAVNERARTAGSTPETLQDTESTETIQEIAELIRGSFRWRMAMVWLSVLMFLESVVWTVMDILRAKRMRLSERIYKAGKK